MYHSALLLLSLKLLVLELLEFRVLAVERHDAEAWEIALEESVEFGQDRLVWSICSAYHDIMLVVVAYTERLKTLRQRNAELTLIINDELVMPWISWRRAVRGPIW